MFHSIFQPVFLNYDGALIIELILISIGFIYILSEEMKEN